MTWPYGEDTVQCSDHVELDLHFAARDGVADGLVADVLAQALADGPSTSRLCAKALDVPEDRAHEVGLLGQSAEDARDSGWSQVGHLGGPADPGGQDRA